MEGYSNTNDSRRSYSRSPVGRSGARSRSPIGRSSGGRSRSPVGRVGGANPRSPRRYPSRSPRRRYPSRSRSPVGGRYERRDNRDSRYPRDSRDYRRDDRDFSRNDRFDRRDRFERRPPRERRPVNRGTEEERANSKTLFIGNLPFHFEERDVAHLMERFGPVRKITIPQERFARKNRGFCFVEFEERRDAEDAMQKYQNYAVEGRELRVDWDVGSERKFGSRPESDDRRADGPMTRSPMNMNRSPMNRSPVNRSRSLSRSPIRPEDY